MEPEVHIALGTERRKKLLNLADPEIRRLSTEIKDSISPAVKPDVDLDKLTETLLFSALLYASRDKLSGLSNKERLRVEVEAAMAVSRQLNVPLSVFGMDVRGFKEINDRLGHSEGDKVIEAVGIGMRDSTRSTDITISQVEEDVVPDTEPNIEVARDGGDEFAAVILGLSLKDTPVVKNRMQTTIAKAVRTRVSKFEETIGHPFEITIGVAQYNPSIHRTAEDLIKAADDNLTEIRNQMGQTRRS